VRTTRNKFIRRVRMSTRTGPYEYQMKGRRVRMSTRQAVLTGPYRYHLYTVLLQGKKRGTAGYRAGDGLRVGN